MMIEIIKKVKIKLKNTLFYPGSIIIENKISNAVEPILLIGTPFHKNIGDHLIAYNELNFIKTLFPNRNVFEIPTDVFFEKEKRIVSNTPKEALIIITGGGWMGDVWPVDEYRMQKIIDDYKHHRIVIFPQTMFYSNTNNIIRKDASSVYSGCDDLTLLLRERKSYEYASCVFGNSIGQIIMAPDMGLYKSFMKYEDHQIVKIGLCLREDREKESSNGFREKITNELKSNGYKVFEFSTMSAKGIPLWKRKNKIGSLIKITNSYDCVITDRLHGMIFSVISGTKCVAYDNSTHKVSGVYKEWLADNPYIKLVNDDDTYSLLAALQELKVARGNTTWNDKIKRGFKTVEEVINMRKCQ